MLAVGLALLGGLALASATALGKAVWLVGRRDDGGSSGSIALAGSLGTVGGCLGAWLVLWALDGAEIAWTRPVVLAAWGGVALSSLLAGWVLGARAPRGVSEGLRSGSRFPVGAWLGAGATVPLFALAALRLWSLHPDFVFHWGIKGWKFYLAQGIDFTYLARPWNVHVHPDYPNLIPGLFAGIAAVAGGFDPATMALATTLFFAALLAAVAALFERLEVAPRVAGWGWVAIAWWALAFSVGFRQAGGADLPMALATTLGAVWLVTPLEAASGWRSRIGLDAAVATTAAFAACCKVEGVVFGGLLVLAHAGRRARAAGDLEPGSLEPAGGRTSVGTGAALAALAALGIAVPVALLVGLWWLQTARHGLSSAGVVGSFDAARLPIVVRGVLQALAERSSAGLLYAVALAPVLIGWRRVRALAIVLSSQLAFYAYVYLTAPADTALLVATSAPRLAFQMVPALFVLAIAFCDLATREDPDAQASASSARDSSGDSSPGPVTPSFLA